MKRVLVANRGEIACRIIQCCAALGLESVAVYSEADSGARHVALADRSEAIGPAAARRSYLDMDAVLQAARRAQADAIHPGYGFLSENAEFARAVIAEGLIWIGPSPETIAAMGDKQEARDVAQRAGVSILPGTSGLDNDDPVELRRLAESVGYPLLVKAAAGGGGIGMQMVESPAALADTVARTRARAERTFADGTVYLEKFIANARHIEIQVFGLGKGRVSVFPERDCSLQRRFQKIVEESPAPGISLETRRRMQEAAARLAVQQDYLGAGTVEFVLDDDTGEFFFLEMNTRIQVEHAVTDMAADVDLVSLQLRLAAGEEIDLPAVVDGRAEHAIEARIYAESPEQGFIPKPGLLARFSLPKAVEGHLRVDCGVREGDAISPHYDPMIAKLTACAESRGEAIDRLLEALEQTAIEGVTSNLDFLKAVLDNARFRAGGIHTDFVARHAKELIASSRHVEAAAS